MAAEFITWDNAVGMTDLESGDLSDSAKELIIQWVEELGIKLTLGNDFGSHEITTSSPELHSIEHSYVDNIIAENFPIISVTRLRDNIQASLASDIITLEEHTNFEINKSAGLIYLVKSDDSQLLEYIQYFTKGYNTVDICYTYGFSEPPDVVKAYADVMAAKLITIWNQIVNSAGSEYTMGDYTSKISGAYKSIETKFDTELENFKINLRNKYGKLV